MEMFLIRLIHLKDIKNNSNISDKDAEQSNENISQTSLSQKKENDDLFETKDKAETIGQMKNIVQEKNVKIKENKETETQTNFIISFNEDLDKDFIKDLSIKLYEWTNNRWIITLSKTKGKLSRKEEEINLKKKLIESVKDSSIYKGVLDKFPDAELIDVKTIEKENKND